MGLFNFSPKPSINLTDFKFLSDDHTRIEQGQPTNANNKGAWRGVRVATQDNITFHVTIYNMNENHPLWGDNIQMAEKRMKLVKESDEKIILRGFGKDAMGASFADYGLTLHKVNGNVSKITLHLHDRNIDIMYEKAEDKLHSKTLNQPSDFDNFRLFTNSWNTNMSMQQKMQIAMQSDMMTNQGADHYEVGDLRGSIEFFEKALAIMPNNDDALKNLRICYTQLSNWSKVDEIDKKLHYLS